MTTRRELLGSATGIAAALLASGCSSDGSDLNTGSGTSSVSGLEVATSDVPVGGGLVIESDKVVVTQPAEGEFFVFTAVCTHSNCTVKDVRDEGIYCGCHGSVFDTSDGSVLDGPATAPLAEITFTLESDKLVIG